MTIIRQTHGLLVFTYNNSVVRSIKQFDQGHTRKGGGVQFGRSVMSTKCGPHRPLMGSSESLGGLPAGFF